MCEAGDHRCIWLFILTAASGNKDKAADLAFLLLLELEEIFEVIQKRA